jgi:alpha-D-xyloside xylohydrolase
MKISRRNLAKRVGFSAAGIVLLPPSSLSGSSANQRHTKRQALQLQEELPGIWRGRVGTPETHTPVSTRLTQPSIDGLNHLPKTPQPELAIAGECHSHGVLLELPLRPEESIYGFGLQLLSSEYRGKRRLIRVNADPKMDTGESHAPIPFYVSSQGYAVLIDTARCAEFFVGNARKKPEKPLPQRSTQVLDPQYTHNLVEGDPGTISVYIPIAEGVDVYVFGGPSMLNAVQRYNLFSGGGCVPPEWGLGFWYRGDGRSNQTQILALAEDFRRRKIPCDVLGLEPGWQSHAYSCTFTWDETRFPNPNALLPALAEKGYKVNLWEHAFTNPASPIFPALVARSGNYGVWGGLVPDFQDVEARKIFGDFHGETLIDKGVSGFKLDECDNSDYTGGWSFPDFTQFPSGVDGEQMHALFGLRYQHAIHEQYVKRKKMTYGLVRSSGALASPYPFVLYSDLYDHRQFIRGLVTAGYSGLLWCPEVRDAKSEEDLIRRLQSVVFSPLAMVNGWYIKNPPWKQIDRKKNNADLFAEGWQDLEARCREIIGWRMQLIPYLLGAFEVYRASGVPPFRALAMDFDTPELRKIDDQYMVGDRMMVAPLFAGESSRNVVLPPGDWHDYWTGKRLSGGQTITVSSDEKNIPVFIKSDTVFPLAEISLTTSASTRSLTVRVYGNGSTGWEGQNCSIKWDGHRNDPVISGSRGYTIVKVDMFN